LFPWARESSPGWGQPSSQGAGLLGRFGRGRSRTSFQATTYSAPAGPCCFPSIAVSARPLSATDFFFLASLAVHRNPVGRPSLFPGGSSNCLVLPSLAGLIRAMAVFFLPTTLRVFFLHLQLREETMPCDLDFLAPRLAKQHPANLLAPGRPPSGGAPRPPRPWRARLTTSFRR